MIKKIESGGGASGIRPVRRIGIIQPDAPHNPPVVPHGEKGKRDDVDDKRKKRRRKPDPGTGENVDIEV
jgi:hypothetical protein